MKSKITFLSLTLFSLLLSFNVSAKDITGKYEGTMKLYVEGVKAGTLEDQAANLMFNKETKTCTILLHEFDFSSFSIPAIKCKVKLKKGIEGYTFDGKINDDSGSFTITGKMKGKLVKKELSVDYEFHFGAMPMAVQTKFKGLLK